MDVRPGGRWRLTMFAGPERREIRWHGEYHVVDEPERLVFTFCDQPDAQWYELVTVVLTDLGDGRTEMRFTQSGRMSPEEYERAGRAGPASSIGSRSGWPAEWLRSTRHRTGIGDRSAAGCLHALMTAKKGSA